LLLAANNRHAKPRLVLDEGVLSEVRRVAIMLADAIGSTTTGIWSTTSDYTSSKKRKLYLQAEQSLREKPIHARDAYVTPFIKDEKRDTTTILKNPRAIHPRKPRYNSAVARYIKPIEKLLYSIDGTMFKNCMPGRIIAKGLDSDGRAKLIHDQFYSFVRPQAISLDVSGFDGSLDEEIIMIEHLAYLRMNPEQLFRQLLKMQRVNFAQIEWFMYVIKGSRMSGDMNTALGNCMLMIIFIVAYMERQNIVYALIDDGDDLILMVERDTVDTASIVSWYRSLGMTLRVDGVYNELKDIVFCQSQVMNYGGKQRLIRNATLVMSKALMSTSTTKANIREKLYLTGCSVLAQYAGIPILQEFARALIRGYTGKITKGRAVHLVGAYDYQQIESFVHDRGILRLLAPVTAEARLCYFEMFGVTAGEQIQQEMYWSAWELGSNWEIVNGDYREIVSEDSCKV